MWEINNSLQLLGFARAAGLGVIICLVYDIFRAFRKAKKYDTFTIFFQDIFFSFFITFAVFLFLLSTTNGELRAFVLIGIFIGFFICRFTVSPLLFKLIFFILSKIFMFFSFVSNNFHAFFELLEGNAVKICKKSGKTLKKLLKMLKGLLYTKVR